MRVAELTAILGFAALPAAAWGQTAAQPSNGAPSEHFRLNWTTNRDTLSSRPGGSPQDVRTPWELGAPAKGRFVGRDMDRNLDPGRGRWFLFAAAGGQAVGWNMSPGAPGDSHWSSGSASTMINDGQAGVGWRRGVMQASVGYVHREVSGRNFDPYSTHLGKVSDSMVGLSFSLHSH